MCSEGGDGWGEYFSSTGVDAVIWWRKVVVYSGFGVGGLGLTGLQILRFKTHAFEYGMESNFSIRWICLHISCLLLRKM